MHELVPEPPRQVAKASRCGAVWHQGKFASHRCRIVCSFSILGGRGDFCSGSSGWAASGFGCQGGLKCRLDLNSWQHIYLLYMMYHLGRLCICSVNMGLQVIYDRYPQLDMMILLLVSTGSTSYRSQWCFDSEILPPPPLLIHTWPLQEATKLEMLTTQLTQELENFDVAVQPCKGKAKKPKAA